MIQCPVCRFIPVFTVDDFFLRKGFSILFQDPPAKVDPFIGERIPFDPGNHDNIRAAMILHHMAGDLFKTIQVGESHVNAAFIFAFQHEDGQFFILCKLNKMLINCV